ncbi:MAG: FtsQ-type POTRA domain-containing protein [Opitutae bacterium]|nr:FtsQ-type POTRA domain-containing protein [Opitutae bacterium]
MHPVLPRFMRKRKKDDLDMPSSWRNLKKSSVRKSTSVIATRRRLGQVGRILFILSFCTLVFFAVEYSSTNSAAHGPLAQNDFTGPSMPVDRILFKSDGVLSQKWFLSWMGPLRNLSLAEVDLKKLHQHLLKEKQITDVSVRRTFPSTLEISIKEREPLLVLRLRDKKDGFKDWLISADGSFYEGSGYSSRVLKSLPSLKVASSLIMKSSENGSYEKLKDMPNVSPLLELARSEYPEIYRDWSVVSYTRPNEKDPGACITVKSKRVGSIRFHPSDYASQLRRLRYLLEEPKFLQASHIRSIDLSHGRSVFANI